MKSQRARLALLGAELRESFAMAAGAIAAHKLRSALTLLGVLIGVFSIIVVMTAMRVLQHQIEKDFTQMGSHTFMIRKQPFLNFDTPEGGMEKIWRRKNITVPQVRRLQEKATLPANIGMETSFWIGQLETRY